MSECLESLLEDDDLEYDHLPRDYGKYRNRTQRVREFCNGLNASFAKFIDDVIDKFDEKMVDRAVLAMVAKIRLDQIRLQKAVGSAFDDIKRCADYHGLFKPDDKDNPTKRVLSICKHKQAAFVLKWFIHFLPACVPPEVNERLEQYRQDWAAKSKNTSQAITEETDPNLVAAIDLLRHISQINEIFIFETVFVEIMGLPRKYVDLFQAHELRDLIYVFTFRASRWQGVDLSLLFHWIQEALTGRERENLRAEADIYLFGKKTG